MITRFALLACLLMVYAAGYDIGRNQAVFELQKSTIECNGRH